jgi:hypothetical protein
MIAASILPYRLIHQQIAATKLKTPQEIVTSLIAMQAQEYAMAKWAIGLRLPGTTDSEIEKSFAKGDILRTHVIRPTWHFVAPADIRWLLALTAPRVMQANAFMYRKMEVDTKLFKRSHNTIVKALEGGNHLTRTELQAALKKAKIEADGIRLASLMMQAELDAIICSGPRKGKQFTYALLDERVAPSPSHDKESSLAEYTLRYFTSRGPATAKDFAYWSGLTMKEVNAGIAAVQSQLESETIEETKYFFIPSLPDNITMASLRKEKQQTTFLMPDYDEYGMSYKNRNALAGGRQGNDYSHWLIIDGKIKGNWQQSVKNNKVEIEIIPSAPLNKTQQQSVNNAVRKYTSFSI